MSSVASAGDAAAPVAALAAIGAALLAAGLWRARSRPVPWAVLAIAAAVGISFSDGGDATRAPLFAGGLLAVAELAYWSLETRVSRPATAWIAVRRIALVCGLVAGSIAVGAVLVSVARVEPGGGLLLEALGVAAAVAATSLFFVLSRRAA